MHSRTLRVCFFIFRNLSLAGASSGAGSEGGFRFQGGHGRFWRLGSVQVLGSLAGSGRDSGEVPGKLSRCFAVRLMDMSEEFCLSYGFWSMDNAAPTRPSALL